MGWLGQAPEHDADHCEADEGCNGPGIALEVAHQAAIAADPCERSLHDPAFRQHNERVQFVALDDLHDPATSLGCGGCHPRSLIAGIGEDAFDEGEQGSRARVQHQRGAVAVLNVGGVDGDAQQQTERVDKDMPLAARDLLARVIALGIERSPPFGAALTLWLSMIAAVGLASRPSRSRTAT
jgi:hypothetical protein